MRDTTAIDRDITQDPAAMRGPTARQGLQQLLRSAGLDASHADAVDFAGDDPLYASPLRIGTAAAVALSAAGVACGLLHGGRRRFAIDLPAAAISTQSFRYLALDGVPVVSPRDALTGFYACRDGATIFLHLNFPHHRARAEAVLGTLASREAIAERVRAWDGAALEQAIVDAGACAALVQDAAQWKHSPQAQALAGLPPVEIVKLGDSAPEPLPGASYAHPLGGACVVDLTRVLAGPVSGRTLAEFGARVTRIEHPCYADLPSYELDTGRDKQACRLDLREAGERERLRAMIRGADVFQQAYRPGVAERFGLEAEALAALRPGLVYTTLSAFGHQGPWASRRGFDSLMQAATGLAMVEGEGRPRLLPTSPIDYVSGYLMAFGTAVALRRRALEGGSYLVRGSLARTAQWIADLGTVPRPDAASAHARAAALVARLSVESTTPRGRLRHLPSALRQSDAKEPTDEH